MKKAQEKLLEEFKVSLEAAHTMIEQIYKNGDNALENVCSEFEEEFDNKGEKWQEGEKGAKNQEERDALTEINDKIEEAVGAINDALDSLGTLLGD